VPVAPVIAQLWLWRKALLYKLLLQRPKGHSRSYIQCNQISATMLANHLIYPGVSALQ